MKGVCVYPHQVHARYRRKVHIPERIYKYSDAISLLLKERISCRWLSRLLWKRRGPSGWPHDLGGTRWARFLKANSDSIPGSLLRDPVAWFPRWPRCRLQLVWLLLLQRRGFNPVQKPHQIISLFAVCYSWSRMEVWGGFGIQISDFAHTHRL